MLSGDPAPSQWALHYQLTDEETEAWREATGSLEPPAPGPCTWPSPRATVWELGERLLPVLPAVREGGVPGTAFPSARRLPTPCSRSWLQAHPSALPIHLLSLPGRASRPYITQRRRSLRQPGWAGGPAPAPAGPTLGLRVGFQARTPACEQGAGASRGGVSLESQSPPREMATACTGEDTSGRCGPWGDLKGSAGQPTARRRRALGTWSVEHLAGRQRFLSPRPHLPSHLLM